MHRFYTGSGRKGLKTLDREREAESGLGQEERYDGHDALCGQLCRKPEAGVESRLDYLEESGVNYVHLMPLLASLLS